jgi:hypothetical protein
VEGSQSSTSKMKSAISVSLLRPKYLKIQALDRELGKMRAKIEKALSKMYAPSQDEVVEGLAGDILRPRRTKFNG